MTMLRTGLTALVLAACAGSATAQLTGPLPPALCAGWEGRKTCELLHEDVQIRVLRCTFPPGVGHEAHYHPPHFGYVLDGPGAMRIASESGVAERVIEADTSFANDVEIRHSAVNVGAAAARYLIVEKKYADARAAGAVTPGLCAADGK